MWCYLFCYCEEVVELFDIVHPFSVVVVVVFLICFLVLVFGYCNQTRGVLIH